MENIIDKKDKTLYLTLKKQWFDMINDGIKTEEYREIKPYWIKRLEGRKYDIVEFRNGYQKDAPKMRLKLKKYLLIPEISNGELKIILLIM